MVLALKICSLPLYLDSGNVAWAVSLHAALEMEFL